MKKKDVLLSEDKQLLVECAVAAGNHGLKEQAYAIIKIFPELILDEEDRKICTSVIYFALKEASKAVRELESCNSDTAQALAMLFSGPISSKTQQDILAKKLISVRN
ncbi:EscG/YscG/SsaH family type III secretion system needle protein co-chaperone [Shewanella sp. 202IG2-18]|uniref:EscG/YscG/SsaH family type III secretion system needle protein co-chaperone n=1 Tax=Parashewanella hymeniacidonis TaxID=2807618 RepID=UPI0019612716|nr:EscG/YscG/SsaH family type III secretion system needle protein co-chaperone [Parashewanella hymeniacidonis]MBM7071409.1 EscG/YscG/SsaH family type III secretion system needle protein co-chaperone [Parashewanella hymeniacidonis]